MMCDRAHLLHECLRRCERTWPLGIDASDLTKLDEFYCAVTGAMPTDNASERKARVKAVAKFLAWQRPRAAGGLRRWLRSWPGCARSRRTAGSSSSAEAGEPVGVYA